MNSKEHDDSNMFILYHFSLLFFSIFTGLALILYDKHLNYAFHTAYPTQMKNLEELSEYLGEKRDDFFEKYLFFLDKKAKKIENVEDINVVLKRLRNNIFKTEEKMKEKEKKKNEFKQEQKSHYFFVCLLFNLLLNRLR